MRQLLDYQADQIELGLYARRITARVDGATVTPRLVRFYLSLDRRHRPEDVQRLEGALALQLGVDRVRVALDHGRLYLDVPRRDAEIVSLYALCKAMPAAPPRYSAVLGIDQRGKHLALCLAAPDVAHVLVAGTTGSGKTALARSMALSLAMHSRQAEIQIALIDPRGYSYNVLAGVPHLLAPIASEPAQIGHLLAELVSEMELRDRQRVLDPRIILFIDELADIAMTVPEALEHLTRLTQRGRGAGIHVVACTQKPTVDAIGSLIKSNFPARLVGSVTSAEDAKVAAGLPGTGAERLLGRGDFLLVVKGEVVRFQAAYANEREARGIVARMATTPRQSRRWVTEYPLSDAVSLPQPRPSPRWTPRVVADNRDPIDRDARIVLDEPGWTAAHVAAGRLVGNWQAEIGTLIGRRNAGAGHYYIIEVGTRILALLSSTTPGGLTQAGAAVGERGGGA